MTVTDHLESRIAPIVRSRPGYSITTESYSADLTVVRATGDLELNSRADLEHAIREALHKETVVLLDLSAVSFIYSGAASVIIDAASRSAGRLEVFAPTRPARMILEALGAAAIVTDPRRY
ncbi:anti-sigma factor antagonist [Rhodococcus sp. 14-2483-1-1]|uniref:STAS domain-containing protein n=1 Tax=Nocardiaceae TaxID=85025 RepID=UPI00050C1194|nr:MULTISPECIES: STAS domain-containing protein [Rhodococcus]OZC45230.1 anti-sigma factor antagonist [Rhodococcus sp. WWJCD1]OZC91593.1 anti-sigma factor antagonist [Rhodococcus sp. 06-412-2C]OZC92160.1 anti-sigma factor antagonist [Rhodococcus sp. 06-412-2B]OZE77131.1 anti-sigma factor antagonist [Rhodococcus sp. 15-649-2-2]OZF31870.1 anti-sigma factor antagonist [Rhodococcus sp. 14-2483-1-1]